MLLVTGGLDDHEKLLSTTEIFYIGSHRWTEVGQLPLALTTLRGVTVENIVLMTGKTWLSGCHRHHLIAGGSDDKSNIHDEILSYNVETKAWNQVGHMRRKRDMHSVSPINFEHYKQYCNQN